MCPTVRPSRRTPKKVMSAQHPPEQHILCATLPGPTITALQEQLQIILNKCDLAEIRIDLLADTISDLELSSLIQNSQLPILLTVRSQKHGGRFTDDIVVRTKRLKQLLEFNPAWIDIEGDLPDALVNEIQQNYPNVRIIRSFHIAPRPDLKDWLSLQIEESSNLSINLLKVVLIEPQPEQILQLASCIELGKCKSQPVAFFATGVNATPSRILGIKFGNSMTFAAVNSDLAVVPGQTTLDELHSIYRFQTISSATKIYGLIGDPVTHSPGHITHNAFFTDTAADARYLKFHVQHYSLEPFLDVAVQLPILGLSVTMPHKQTVADLLQQLNPVNTLTFVGSPTCLWKTANTDKMAAYDLLKPYVEMHLKKHVLPAHAVVLGAGGAAAAVAIALQELGCRITILNRDVAKAKMLAELVMGGYGSLDDFLQISQSGYDLLVQATRVGDDAVSCPIDINGLLPSGVLLELIHAVPETTLLKRAKQLNYQVIAGKDFFAVQARNQRKQWGLEYKIEE